MPERKIYQRNKYVFSQSSLKQLATLHPDLQRILKVTLMLGIMDFSVREGTRSDARQEALKKAGKSKVGAGGSMHNTSPSLAVDVAPYFVNRSPTWHDFMRLAGIIQSVAVMLGTPVRWGGDWDQDGEALTDQDFDDGYHFELTLVRKASDLPFVPVTINIQ